MFLLNKRGFLYGYMLLVKKNFLQEICEGSVSCFSGTVLRVLFVAFFFFFFFFPPKQPLGVS